MREREREKQNKVAERESVYVCMSVLGGEDDQDAISLWVIFCKRALQFVALLRKEPCNFRHPMHCRHLVSRFSHCALIHTLILGGFNQ